MARRRRNPIARGQALSAGEQNKTQMPRIKVSDNLNRADSSLKRLMKSNIGKKRTSMKGGKYK